VTVVRGARVVVTGGTGSLGQTLTRQLLEGRWGRPESVTCLSRDEAKQHRMRADFLQQAEVTEDAAYLDATRDLRFILGDVRDYHTVVRALRDADVVVNAAALKQVPSCEYFPHEAVRTNVDGAEHLVRAICEHRLPVRTVVAVSTDKACHPTNVMGMSKAIQERILLSGRLRCPDTRFVGVRYGNVIASRGSVVPLFLRQIAHGGPVTLTDPRMTRFLLSLDEAVATVMAAITEARDGEITVPRIRAVRIEDLARALIGTATVDVKTVGIRPGEKLHETLITAEEAARTRATGDHLFVGSALPELASDGGTPAIDGAYSSDRFVMDESERAALVERIHRLAQSAPGGSGDVLG
jgi:UDP-glucose 4-epimerase